MCVCVCVTGSSGATSEPRQPGGGGELRGLQGLRGRAGSLPETH